MENQMTIFKHPAFGEVRTTIMDNGQVGFVGKDIATALGYSNPMKAIRDHVDDEDKRGERFVHPQGGTQTCVIINESGLYSLILSSKLPQAKQFKHWVTSEVLPAIRKDGGYIATKPDDTPEAITARALLITKSTIDQLEQEKDVLTQQNRVLSAKAEHLDNVLLCNQCYTTTQIAKELDMSINDLTAKLLEMRIIYRQSGQYMLYAPFARLGLARNKTVDVNMHGVMRVCHPYLVWTEKGRIFIHNLMKQHLSRVTIGSAALLIQPSLFS